MLVAADSSPVPGKPSTGVVPPPVAARASGQPASCPMAPAAAAANEKDGLFPLLANMEGLIVADITSFIAIGNQAAAGGRPRDAEAALLMACRVADKLKGAAAVESADAKYQLGALYAGLALNGSYGAGPQRAELLGRAERLYAGSSQAYLASYGQAHEKSQLAANGLAAVRQAMAATPLPLPAQAQTASPAPLPAQAQTASPTPLPAQAQTAPPAPNPVEAQTAPPAPARVPKLAIRVEESEKPARQAPRVAASAPVVRPLPPAAAQGSTRRAPPVFKECLPAVATLGLCDPGT